MKHILKDADLIIGLNPLILKNGRKFLFRIRLKYSKGEELKFIGHLDIVRLWERTLRRADLPIVYTEGYNPRQKMSFGPPLSLGITSDFELQDIYLEKWINPKIVMEILNNSLPSGIKIQKAEEVFLHLPSLTAAIKTAIYELSSGVVGDGNHFLQAKEILSTSEIIIQRKEKKINIRPFILDIEKENSGFLKITVQCDNFGTLKAQEIVNLFTGAELRNLKRIELK